MPYVKQICHHDVSPKQAEEAWWDFVIYAAEAFNLPTTAFYGGSTDFTTKDRTCEHDIIFVVELNETPGRVKAADSTAHRLARFIMYDQYERGYGDVKVGMLLHYGPCGWGESTED